MSHLRSYIDDESFSELVEETILYLSERVGVDYTTAQVTISLKSVNDSIDDHLKNRYPHFNVFTLQPKATRHHMIILPFSESTFSHTSFGATVRLPRVRNSLPDTDATRKWVEPPKITYKFADSIGLILDNSTSIYKNSTYDEIVTISQRNVCKCQNPLYSHLVHPTLGHIATCKLSILPPSLRDACAFGRKHRLEFCALYEGQTVSAAIRQATGKYIELLTKAYANKHPHVVHPNIPNFTEYGYELENALVDTYQRRFNDRGGIAAPPLGQGGIILDDATMKEFTRFSKNFVTTCADKAAQDFAWICSVQYAKWLIYEVTKPNSSYTEVQGNNYLPIITTFKTFLLQHKPELKCVVKKPEFAILKCIVKYHKNEAAKMARFIAASNNIFSTTLAVRINFFLGHLTSNFESLWHDSLSRAHAIDDTIPTHLPSWVCTGSEVVADTIRQLNNDVPKHLRVAICVATYDFATLYTLLSQDDLIGVFDSLFDQIFSGLGAGIHGPPMYSHLAYCSDTGIDDAYLCAGIPANPVGIQKKYLYISLATLKASFSILIKNTYVKVGDKLFHQTIGIPMGVNPAVHIANYFLFHYELAFINKLIDHGKIDVLKTYLRVKRYIDDLLYIGSKADAALFHQLVSGDFFFPDVPGVNFRIYPVGLTCGKELGPGHKVHFLDVSILYNHLRSRWETDIYSKRNDPKFKRLSMRRYPDISSKLTKSVKYNVITSETIRYFRLVSRKARVITLLAELARTLLDERHYRMHDVKRYFLQVFRRVIPHYNLKSAAQLQRLVFNRLARLRVERR